LNRGQRLTELLKQPQFQPLTWQQMTVVLFAGTQGYLDDLQVADIHGFEQGLYKYFASAQSQLMNKLTEKKALDDDIKNGLHAALKEYSANFKAELEAAKEPDAAPPAQAESGKKDGQAAKKSDAAPPAQAEDGKKAGQAANGKESTREAASRK
jgi:F-type H+-transporting ATPase subunit alpha